MNEYFYGFISSETLEFVLSMIIPLLFVLFMVKERNSRYILAFFCYGLFSVILAYFANMGVLAFTNDQNRTKTVIAPIMEELMKALPLLIFLRKKNNSSDALIISCGIASGIGFSIQETLHYLISYSSDDGLVILVPLIIRTVTTCLMHGMSTAVLAFGLTITRINIKIVLPMLFGLLSLSVTIHSLYNLLIGTKLTVAAMLMPAILYLMGLAVIRNQNDVKLNEKSE